MYAYVYVFASVYVAFDFVLIFPLCSVVFSLCSMFFYCHIVILGCIIMCVRCMYLSLSLHRCYLCIYSPLFCVCICLCLYVFACVCVFSCLTCIIVLALFQCEHTILYVCIFVCVYMYSDGDLFLALSEVYVYVSVLHMSTHSSVCTHIVHVYA